MKILGLDQSKTRAGWALIDGRTVALSGWWQSDTTEAFGDVLRGLLIDCGPDLVVFERPIGKVMVYGGKAVPNAGQMKLHWIAGMIEMGCLMRGIPCELVASNTWRAAVIGPGAGRLGTDAAKAAAKLTCDRLGLSYANADVAEAILIGLWGATCDRARLMAQEASECGQSSGR